MNILKHLKAQRVSVVGAVAAAVLCGLLGGVYAFAQGGLATPTPPDVENAILSGDDYYKDEGGVIYEWDDGRWEIERDKKIVDGVVYEFEHGVWVREDPPAPAPAPAPTPTPEPAQPAQPAQPAPQQNTIVSGDDTYMVENGVVYEWDDGAWEVEHDKKVEDGVVWEYDDGMWEIDYDDDYDDYDDDFDDDDYDDDYDDYDDDFDDGYDDD